MPFIAILGCDGSGKSSVIEKLTYQLLEQDHRVQHGHWRPSLFGAYSAKAKKSSAPNPHGSSDRGSFSSLLKLLWIGFNWWFEWLRVLRKASRNGYLVFDRFHADLIVDPFRYRYGGSMRLAEWFTKLMPQPDLVIYLDAPIETLLSRKREVAAEALNKARESYLNMCAQPDNYFVLDASNSINQVVSEAIDIINSFDGHH